MGTAVISADGLHRYVLTRDVTENVGRSTGTLGVFGVNPSTAEADKEDPTTRRIYGFALRNGFTGYMLGNEFAYRATDVKELAKVPVALAIGPENDKHIADIMRASTLVLFAWGPLGKLPPRLRERWKDMVRMADAAGKTPQCLGRAQDGHPRHPLMLPNDTWIVPWPVPWFPNRVPPEDYSIGVEERTFREGQGHITSAD